MCGIAGLWRRGGLVPADGPDGADDRGNIGRLTSRLSRRGPDGDGIWADPAAGIALGHRRLAIIDLSDAGRQPMESACGRYLLTYNGEIYNYAVLRDRLAALGHRFRGHSDTEVLLTGIAEWGMADCLRQAVGMFAIALWDRKDRSLTLARDRLGIKPLYYGWPATTASGGDLFLFASQPGAFTLAEGWQGRIDPQALDAFFRFNYIPAPLCIWQGFAKLPPGTWLRLAHPGDRDARPQPFWDLHAVVAGARAGRDPQMKDAEAVAGIDAALREAVRLRMVADVPLGGLLSGGVDSSTIVALMQAQSPRPVKTFTIGFDIPGYNEAEQAKAIAGHLGTDHHELYLGPQDALDLVPDVPESFDEPFADASQLPTTLVSRLARGSVTVALSGDGGDEVFAGYTRYALVARLAGSLGRLPAGLRRAMGAGIQALPPEAWSRAAGLLPARHRPRLFGDRLHKLARIIGFVDGDDLYEKLIRVWQEPPLLPGLVGEAPTAAPPHAPPLSDLTERMMLRDTGHYLPDDILAKVDRASMSVGLEARVPILDHNVVAAAWALPQRFKIRGGVTKWALRQVLAQHVPPALTDRPKMGFAVPIEHWLRGPLREWAEDLLSPQSLDAGGMIDGDLVRARLAEHQSGRRNWQYQLWGVLMFEAWRRRWAA
ncbi:asparagine synthase (glutamine-hydrolyzing) [Marinibaculum pumilum]|uniref:asparagine synthase (glutamine-hydrolyzing) n=1 Tax=Marinibaculum pumilum TaxID=1766165 RepID=A0ABV7KXV2_9PROT